MSEIKKTINFKSSELEKLYVAINPNIEVTEQGYVWFNSSDTERDNAYPNKLIDLYTNASAVHSNFINLKANLIFGSGLIPLDPNDTQIKAFLEMTNRAGHTINDIIKKMSFDMSLMESAALQVIYNAEGKIAEVYHCNPANLRASAPNEFGYSDHWYYSTKWGIVQNKRVRKQSNMLSNAVKIANFNPANGKADKRQILYLKKYSPSPEEIYAIASYNAILPWVQLDYELSQFHLNKVQNSFSSSAIITLKGNPSDEERDAFVRNFKMKHTGSDAAGKVLFMWVDGENQQPEIMRMEADRNDTLFEQINDLVNEHISIGHGAPLALIGLDKTQSIGNDSMKINTVRAYFINTVIEPMQEVLLAGINKLLKHNGLGQVKIVNKPLALDGSNQADTNQSNTNNGGSSGSTSPSFNAELAGLTGKQFINMNRIVRNIKNGKMTKAAGVLMLKNSFGFDEETIDALIADEIEDDKLVEQNKTVA